MEAKQWVRRERCPEDRRQVLCYLTPQGRDLLSGLDSSMSRLDQQTLSMLSEAEIDSLIAILDKIRG
jgi:DNA-binding MarR family transcriptional regulator